MSKASTVEATRASVTKSFQKALFDERASEIKSFVKKRIASQFTTNLDADSSALYELVEPHLESFNWIFNDHGGLQLSINNLPEIQIVPNDSLPSNFPHVRYSIQEVKVGKPTHGLTSEPLLPHQARELGLTYDAPLIVRIKRQVGDGVEEFSEISCGRIPIMVRSSKCHLYGLSRRELVQKKEEAGEWGGYFIMNGNERLVRLLVMTRRNYIFAMDRGSFLKRGPEFTKYATSIRCVRQDQSALTVVAHYLETGTVKIRMTIRKQEFFIPAALILKALTGMSDREMYEKIAQNDPDNAFESERTEMMIREIKELGLSSRNEALSYLGRHFRTTLGIDPHISDARAGLMLLDQYLFIHIQDFDLYTPSTSSSASTSVGASISHDSLCRSKADLLLLMIRKLFKLVQGKIKPDNVDALSAHEPLLPGHLFSIFLKEQLFDLLHSIKGQIISFARQTPDKLRLYDDTFWRERIYSRLPDIGMNLRYFIVTGNLRSRTGLDLMQISGYSVGGEKLNYFRYLSHFRAIHRGKFFTTMKTTAVRKLLPESWGFVCPVHTPDGSPCGLLNHLSRSCRLLCHNSSVPRKDLIAALFALGMSDVSANPARIDDLPVLLDGVYIGKIPKQEVTRFTAVIRHLKVTKHPSFDEHLEIFAINDYNDQMWPSVALTTTTSRFMRPVYYLPPVTSSSLSYQHTVPKQLQQSSHNVTTPIVEYIGSQEQLSLEIACLPDDYSYDLTTHQEICPTNMLSVIASMTPFSDHNQSPRNMYQCQMGKQTMSTPYHSHPYRVDNKVYRLQNPQTPLVRNEGPYQKYLFDEYPMGVNSVVAVISYTGYDMEDAMIINKSAYERGFGHGSVYRYKVADLGEKRIRGDPKIYHHFRNVKKPAPPAPGETPSANPAPEPHIPSLDVDGLPHIGQMIRPDEPLYATFNDISETYATERFKDTEPAFVEQITALNTSSGDGSHELQRVSFKLRMDRNPVIGDKFSSRHGQKGVLSNFYPQIDMPWTESGISPDVIINPHAFPSRMTIGMLVESIAGKAGALHGRFQDGTPFQFDENNRAVDYFGQQLRAAGYNYLGSEPLYSGISGEPLMADIFIGLVYYQRLRHMVKDKFQARATGPINSLHKQPIKGRKLHGGIRLGEMERDSLIAHGASYLLQDRLVNCSDYHKTYACKTCGSIISVQHQSRRQFIEKQQQQQEQQQQLQLQQGDGEMTDQVTYRVTGGSSASHVHCRLCGNGDGVVIVGIPYVFLYLVNELAAMNIRLTLDIK